MDKDTILGDFLPQILATTVGTFTALSDGMTYGWTSPMIPYFMSNQTHIAMTHDDCEWLKRLNLIGYACAFPLTIFMVGYFGRKSSMIVAAAIACTSWTSILLTYDKYVIMAARFLAGVSGDIAFVATPMYIAEIADYRIRGFLSSFIYCMMIFGALVVYCFGAYSPYWVSPAIGAGLTACQAVFLPFFPESPYYYIYHNQPEKAKAALAGLRSSKNIESSLKEITREIEKEKSMKTSPINIIKVKSNRLALCITFVLNSAPHFVGLSVFLMNVQGILEQAGSEYIKPAKTSIAFAATMLVTNLIAAAFVDKYGRNFLLKISSTLTGIALLALAIFFHAQSLGYDVSSASWIPAASLIAYAATLKIGLASVPLVVVAEIFPTSVKALGMTISDVFDTIAAVTSVHLYQFFVDAYGLYVPIYIFAFISFAMILNSIWLLPETKGKTLEEIQELLEDKTLKKSQPERFCYIADTKV